MYATSPRIDVADFATSVRLTAARAAAIVADDLPSSVALVRRLEGDRAGGQSAARGNGAEIVQDLLRFWVSEPAGALRRRVGLV